MSFTEEKRDQVKKYILEKIDNRQSGIAKRAAEAFDTSLNTIYRYIREMEEEGIIQKEEKKYKLTEKKKSIVLVRSSGEIKEEDTIYEKYIHPFVKDLSANVQQIWQYSFMEMMNNAIDHSEAEGVRLLVSQTYMNTSITLVDNGIGIFRKIKEYYNYENLDDAVNELFKGKLTTDSQNHSGEGIFFTSRILDRFAAISDGKVFTHDKYEDRHRNMEDMPTRLNWKDYKGTIIYMRLSNFSNKLLKEVFDMFSDVDGGFTKTNISIKNIFETYPVSRSQAKRLCHRFDKFHEVELDFSEVEEIGQAFAHEIFVVFQNKYPNVMITALNTNESVQKMINHVKKTNI